VPRLCEVYPGFCLTTEEKARKNLSQDVDVVAVVVVVVVDDDDDDKFIDVSFAH
jgi:hypothetical protein